MRNFLAKLLSRYLMPDYEAHKRSALLYTSANEVTLRKDLEHFRQRALTSEKHVDMFCDVSDKLVKLAMDVPDGEMTPFVHQAICEVENARRYVK